MTRPLAYLLAFVLLISGFAGLGYQSVWIRMVSLGLGHDYLAVLGVVAAFFCGLGLGSLLLDRPVSRSPRPDRWYAGLEAAIGLWALALIAIIPAVNDRLPGWLGLDPAPVRHWGIAFLVPFLMLLPATLAMGGTLPAADRLVMRLRRDGRGLGGVYGANTFGAMAGALVATFFILPALGHAMTLIVLAGLNLAAAALLLTGVFKSSGAPQPAEGPAGPHGTGPALPLLAVLFLTGLLGIGYEILVIRALSQVLENTVFSFASVLATYLLGTALGAALYHRVTLAHGLEATPSTRPDSLLQVQGMVCLLGVVSLWGVGDVYDAVRALPLGTMPATILAEMAAGALVFLVPTMVMGAVFTALAQRLRRPDGGVGAAFAVNTFGAALAPFLFGAVVLPLAGAVGTLILISVAYLVLMPSARLRILAPSAATAAAAAVLLLGPAKPDLLDLPEGATLRQRIEGMLGTVTVYNDAVGHTHLKINNHYVMGGTATRTADRRQGHIPLLMHGAPEKALFLGVGTGATFAAAAYHPDLQADAVELVPEVLDVLPAFTSVSGETAELDRLRLHAGDARRFVAATGERYDVIVADTFHPSRDGAALLYTVDHFQAIKDRLAEGGLFCQWLPLHQLDLDTLRLIIRSFQAVYPDAVAVMNDLSLLTPVIGLVGGTGPLSVSGRAIPHKPLLAAMADTKLFSPVPGLEGFLGGPDALKAFAGAGPLNTDDHPVALFQAPRAVYGGLGDPGERLMVLVDDLSRDAPSGLAPRRVAPRLEKYWRARDRFLALGVYRRHALTDTGQTAAAEALSGPLLKIVRMSPDFTPAYDPLIAMAVHLHGENPGRSMTLLMDMARANPARREAPVLLARWFPGNPLAAPDAQPSLRITP
ncbi:MAG: MnmC family methyltransferase [Alphaproteobacteria bacterium]